MMKDQIMSTAQNLKAVLESTPPAEDATSVEAKLVADLRCELGEGIIYDDVHDTVLWTDILGRKFHKLPLSGSHQQQVQTFNLPAMVGSFALRPPSERGYLVAWENGFQLYSLETGESLSDMSIGEDVNPSKLPTRLNDGRCDREGRRYLCGGYYGDVPGMTMKVYKCEIGQDGKLHHAPICDNMRVTNSICFSLDGSKMYLADSPTKMIHSFDYNKQTGEITEKKLLHKKIIGVPDGSCIDSEGYLWNAVWRSGAGPSMVHRIHPVTGEVDFTVHMPDGTSQVTCCCFGGKELDVLFLSTAAENTDATKEPHAGGIYAVKLAFRGKKETRFVGK